MTLPEFDDRYFAIKEDGPDEQLEQLCFRAQEILGAYCLYDFSLVMEEEMPAEFKPILPRYQNDSSDDDDLEVGDFVSHEKTTPIPINDSARAIMDNIPLVVDEFGNVQQYIQPGFVSLKVIDDDDYAKIFVRRSLVEVSPKTTQLIFRLPWHADGAAIFQGFNMADDEIVEIDEESEEKIHSFLEDVVDALRSDLKEDASAGIESYCFQNIPVVSVGSAASLFLRHQR